MRILFSFVGVSGLLVLAASGLLAPATASAGICAKDADFGVSASALDFCRTAVNTKVDAKNNGLMLTNPSASCNLAGGLNLPGLPSFGAMISGLDSCKLLKNITGAVVDQVNKASQLAVDQALERVTSGVPGMNSEGQVEVDVGGKVEDYADDAVSDPIKNFGAGVRDGMRN